MNYYKHQKLPITNDYSKTLAGRNVRLREDAMGVSVKSVWLRRWWTVTPFIIPTIKTSQSWNEDLKILQPTQPSNRDSPRAKNQSCIAMRGYIWQYIPYCLNNLLLKHFMPCMCYRIDKAYILRLPLRWTVVIWRHVPCVCLLISLLLQLQHAQCTQRNTVVNESVIVPSFIK